MSKQDSKAAAAQGAAAAPTTEEAKEAAMNLETVKGYLKKDLSIAVSCLNAILSDPDLLDSTANFMLGRLLNAKHKPNE